MNIGFNMKAVGSAGLCLSLATVVACSGGGRTDSEVVATFGEKEITAGQIDARVLALPPTERPRPGEDLDEWFKGQIRDEAVDLWIRDEAEASGLAEDPAFVTARRETERQTVVQQCLAELYPDVDYVSEEALELRYQEHQDDLEAPERRMVSQIFLRLDPGESQAQLEVQAERLRDRVLAGENFGILAAEFSESEARHRQGSIGWFAPGDLPDGFDHVVFALEEGLPSHPVVTVDGVHLFHVDQILRARRLSLAEARSGLKNRMVSEQRMQVLEELESRIDPPADSVVLDRDAFIELAGAGDDAAVVLSIDDMTVSLGDLKRLVGREASARSGRGRGKGPGSGAWAALDNLRRRELIYHHCLDTGAVKTSEIDDLMRDWSESALVDLQRHRLLVDEVESDDTRLRTYYENNLGFFSTSPTWTLRRLQIPLDDAARRTMARLESAAKDASANLEGLARELGGEVEDLGEMTLPEIRRIDGRLPALVSPLKTGQVSAPYRGGETLDVVEVVARTPASPIPYDEVRDRVAAAYVNQYTREVYDELATRIFADTDLVILPGALEQLRQEGLPSPDVSVEEIEDLLNQL